MTKLRLAAMCIATSAIPACAGNGPQADEMDKALSALEQNTTWAWALGVGLIVADLVLPVPQTAIIAALGIIYGPALGGLIGAAGLVGAGAVAFGLMRTSARRVCVRVVGQRSMDRIGAMGDSTLPWAIVLTRSLPYSVPEAVTCAAGLSNMRRSTFFAALTVGSVPVATGFALLGATWSDRPALALGASYLLPITLLPITMLIMRKFAPQETPRPRDHRGAIEGTPRESRKPSAP